MVVAVLVAGLVLAGGVLVAQIYLQHTPTVASRLSEEPRWPWITALVLMGVAVAFFAVNWFTTMVLNPEAFGPTRQLQYWEYLERAGVVVTLLLCMWIACYRPLASALLLLAMWFGTPAAIAVQTNVVAGPGEFTPRESFIEPLFLGVLFAPAFVVALLLMATARSLAPKPESVDTARDVARASG